MRRAEGMVCTDEAAMKRQELLRRSLEAPDSFDANGWLQIGFCGHQPGVGETYISTGSLYLCAVGLLPLGLRHRPRDRCPATASR